MGPENGEFIVVKAWEVILAQFTENISAIKIKGRAMILTKHGSLLAGREEEGE